MNFFIVKMLAITGQYVCIYICRLHKNQAMQKTGTRGVVSIIVQRMDLYSPGLSSPPGWDECVHTDT